MPFAARNGYRHGAIAEMNAISPTHALPIVASDVAVDTVTTVTREEARSPRTFAPARLLIHAFSMRPVDLINHHASGGF